MLCRLKLPEPRKFSFQSAVVRLADILELKDLELRLDSPDALPLPLTVKVHAFQGSRAAIADRADAPAAVAGRILTWSWFATGVPSGTASSPSSAPAAVLDGWCRWCHRGQRNRAACRHDLHAGADP